jgi:hypothetical protein
MQLAGASLLYHWQSIMFRLTLSDKYQGMGILAHAVLGRKKRARSGRRALSGSERQVEGQADVAGWGEADRDKRTRRLAQRGGQEGVNTQREGRGDLQFREG